MRLETKNRDHKLTIKILTEVIDKLALETLPHRLLYNQTLFASRGLG